jgi:hypothetical protein
MRNKIILIFITSITILTGFSCTKNFDEINSDPSLVTRENVAPSMILTAVLKNSIFDSYNDGVITEYSGYYSNQASGAIFRSTDWANPFSDYYTNYLINTAEVIRLTASRPDMNDLNAMARIWRVWLYHRLTDAYGDIPYTDAVQDIEHVKNQPGYDSQEYIYRDMLKELKEAAAQLGSVAGQLPIGSADLLYNGDAEAWKRFANSLRLRLAIRVSYAAPELTQEQITDLGSADFIETNDQNAKLVTKDVSAVNASDRNPLYNRYENQSFYPMWATFTTTDNLLRLNDPRLAVYAEAASDGVAGYRGRPLGLGADQKPRYTETSTAVLGSRFWNSQYDIIVMNAAEVSFLRAEAALRGFITDDAQALYADGINKALEQYEIDPTAYLSSPAATLTGTDEEKLEQIIVQKWLAIYFESNEAWAEYRRTGYPRIWLGTDADDNAGEIPRRIRYPLDEYAKNEVNVSSAVSKLTDGDQYASKVWWDKKDGLPFNHPRQGMYPPEQP